MVVIVGGCVGSVGEMGENPNDCESEVGFVLRVLQGFKLELLALFVDVVWLIT